MGYSISDGKNDNVNFSSNKTFTRNDVLVCGSYGYIYAIHKTDGSRLWKTSFIVKSSIISLFVTDNDKLIAGIHGKTACLDLMTGALIWENNMPGFGYEEVSIVSTPSRSLMPHATQSNTMVSQPHYNQNIVPPHYNDSILPEKAIVLACSRGKAMGIDAETGETLWTYNIPVVIVEPPNVEGGRLQQLAYIGAARWVYCLIARTGTVVWSIKVATGLFGVDFMTLATPWSSRLAAESHSAFSQNPSAQCLELQRQKQRKREAAQASKGNRMTTPLK